MQGCTVSYFRLFLFSLFSSVILVSCGGGGSNDLPKTDTTKPTVTLTPDTPPAGQRVPVITGITAKFNKAMNKLSVETGFIVTPNNGGTIVYEANTKTATFRPANGTDLQGDTEYKVTLQNSIKDTSNNFLVEEKRTFKTEDNVPPTVITTIPNSTLQPIPINGIIRIEFSEPMDLATFKQQFNNTELRNFDIRTGTTIVTGSGIDPSGFLGSLTSTGTFVDYQSATPSYTKYNLYSYNQLWYY